MNTLDIIVIAIMLVCVVVGYFKGFVKTAFGLFSAIIAVLLTLFLSPIVSGYIVEHTEFNDQISEKVIQILELDAMDSDVMLKEDEFEAIDKLKLPSALKDMLSKNNNREFYELLVVDTFGGYIGGMMAVVAVNALSFIGVFIVISIILNILTTLLDLVSHLPILNEVNKMAGAGVGLMLGVVIVWVFNILLGFVLSIQATTVLSELIESSVIQKFLYNNNPLMRLLFNVSKVLKF